MKTYLITAASEIVPDLIEATTFQSLEQAGATN